MNQETPENPILAEPVVEGTPSDQNGHSTGRRGLSISGWISWFVIAAFTLFILGKTTVQQFGVQETSTEATLNDLLQVNLQAKMIVGQKKLEQIAIGSKPSAATKDDADPATASDQGEAPTSDQSDVKIENAEQTASADDADVATDTTDTTDITDTEQSPAAAEAQAQAQQLKDLRRASLDTGSYEQRLCNVAITNEAEGPSEALKYLDTVQQKVVDNDFQRSTAQTEMESSVRRLLENYRDGNLSSDVLDDSEKEQLQDRLGFCGELLLNPPGSKTVRRLELTNESKTMTIVAVVGVIMAILFFLFGIVALLFILTYVLTGSSPSRFVATEDHTNVYVETFALWLIAFFGVQILVQRLELLKTIDQQMIANPIFFFGSLLVLLWPVLRGISVSQMLADIGWTRKHFVRNTFLSVPAYAAWLPAVLVGFFFVFVLMGVAPLPTTAGEFSVPAMPGHPIQQVLSNGNMIAWITVIIAACVAAPIVEETMFRGVLYRHLRGLTMKHGLTISILASATINGVIFASLHPQGILAVPLLTTLAIGFSLVREWRNSLWTSILMHAFNNSMVTFVLFCIL